MDTDESYKSKSNFDYENGDMFEAFAAHPEIPTVLIAMVLFSAVLWIHLLRNFSRPIVFLTELLKVAAILYMAWQVPNTISRAIFVIGALVYLGLVFWSGLLKFRKLF